MVEPIMYLAIGFMISMLLGLMIVPLVHNRAVRLTTRRLEAATPLSMAEIQADKDQLRAEFAMSARRLEINVEQLKNKTTSQLAELGKKSDAINRMKVELSEKNVTIFSFETHEKVLKDRLRVAEEELAARDEALRGIEQALSNKQGELQQITHELSDQSTTAENRQIELTTVHAQAGEIERKLYTRSREAEQLAARVADLENRLANQAKLAAAREHENDVLRQQIEAARLRHDAPGDNASGVAASGRLPAASSLANERMENAVLRERINDIAAEVAKLATTIEGPNSPIEAILAAEPAAARGASAGAAGMSAGGTLADRIRALQSHASRPRQMG